MTLEHALRDAASQIDLRALLAVVEPHLHGKTCSTRDGKLSPFLNKPHDKLVPGRTTEAAFKFHEIYPKAFKERTYFMGERREGGMGQCFWQCKFDRILCQYGHFDESGAFHAPIAIYRNKGFFTDFDGSHLTH